MKKINAKLTLLIIVYNMDDGEDRVIRLDKGAGSTLTYRFGTGIDPNTFKLREGSLMLDFANGDKLHINDIDHQDVFNSLENCRFEFADGTVRMRWCIREAANDETVHVWRVAA